MIELDEDGYPTESAIEYIKNSKPDRDPMGKWALGLLAEIEPVWAYYDWQIEDGKDVLDKPVRRFHVSTAGWSGNEDIILALQSNFYFWPIYWEQSRRGGHYIFAVPI